MPILSKLHARAILLTLAGLFAATNARAQSIAKVGLELQVNSYTSGRQTAFSVDLDGDGDFVVAWESSAQDGDSYGIFARRFNAGGVPQASEFQVNSFTLLGQRYPDVALGNGGDFIIVWSGRDPDDPLYASIFGRRFDSSGQALAAEFRVNSYTSGSETRPRVAIDAEGNFVVAWVHPELDGSATGIFARRFNSAGAPQSVDFQVNSHTIDNQRFPDVAKGAAGDFMVVWQSFGQDQVTSEGVFGRAFDSAGVPQASEFQVTQLTMFAQRYPSVAAGNTGGFVVTWQSDQYSPVYNDIFARRFSAAGSPLGEELRVNASAGPFPTHASPAVATEPDGDFVVAWHSFGGQDGDFGSILARRFNAAGTAQTPEMLVNSHTVSSQVGAAIGMDGNGGFVIVWVSDHDGSMIGGFGQRFETLAVLDVDGDGSIGPLTDGLLSLRYQFGFRGSILVSGAVNVGGCRRCDAAAIESYLQELH